MTAGTTLQRVLKCEFCGTTTKHNGQPYISETGMRYHEATCEKNPKRVNWSKYSSNKRRKPHANGKRESVPVAHEQDIVAEEQLKNYVSFAVGHCKTWLDLYAESLGIPGAALAHRVGEVLFRSSRGRVLGSFYQVPGV